MEQTAVTKNDVTRQRPRMGNESSRIEKKHTDNEAVMPTIVRVRQVQRLAGVKVLWQWLPSIILPNKI